MGLRGSQLGYTLFGCHWRLKYGLLTLKNSAYRAIYSVFYGDPKFGFGGAMLASDASALGNSPMLNYIVYNGIPSPNEGAPLWTTRTIAPRQP